MEITQDFSSIIDLVLLGIILISIIIAFARGFITEALSLFVWIGAFLGATFYFDDVAKLLPNLFGGSDAANLADSVDPSNVNEVVIASGISFVITFLGLLFLFGLLNLLISMLIRRLKISWPDRLLGALFGLLRGMFVVAVIGLFISYSPLKEQASWKNAKLSASAESWSKQLSRLVPDNFLERIDTEKIINDLKKEDEALQFDEPLLTPPLLLSPTSES